MAKKIKLYSKLPNEEQNYINSQIKNSELKVIYVTADSDSKKGVIVTSEEDEILIIFDIKTEHIVTDNNEEGEDEIEDLNDDVELEEDEEKLK